MSSETDGLDIPCPRCGEERRFGEVEVMTQRKLHFTCATCQAQVVILNDIPDDDGPRLN
jgi:endogenous inhibitor of DNA gyrase (YacG/DUF329 family)